jgi:hypothetical protein
LDVDLDVDLDGDALVLFSYDGAVLAYLFFRAI